MKGLHNIFKVGDNSKAAPQLFYVFDGSVVKLIDFNAKIKENDGSVKTYRQGDLLTESLSDRRIISEIEVRILPIMESLNVGDLIEIVSIHEQTLPPLGIRFSPSDIGEMAANISCSIEIPLKDSLNFKVVNDNLSPRIFYHEKTKIYRFDWSGFSAETRRNIFSKRNNQPEILAAMPRFKLANSLETISINNWKDFGNWYLKLIEPKTKVDERIFRIAKEITQGKTTDKEKMDAIFDYCQKNIRYEQVYIEKGEFIPNDCQTILARKYGDCKDYSTLIYSMAKSIGLEPNLALCHRGRGFEIQEDIPVNQFNHVIVYFSDGQSDFWYDGTNRTGIPGITTIDLINELALVLKKDESRLLTIAESQENDLSIEGSQTNNNQGLAGNLKISLAAQYAIDFFLAEMYLNKADMTGFIIDWIKENISKDIIIQSISYTKEKKHFIVNLRCDLPNSVFIIPPYYYVSLAKVFNKLLPQENLEDKPEQIFYFPHYNRVNINLRLLNLYAPEIQSDISELPGYNWQYSYNVLPGPFDAEQKLKFIQMYKIISEEFTQKIKLKKKESLL